MEPCKKCSVSRAVHCISLRGPTKGDLPPRSPHKAPIDGNASFTECSFTVKVPGKGPPLPKGPLWREARFQSLPYISFSITCNGALPPGSPRRAPLEKETLRFQSPPSSVSQSPR
jgi:hypothetical protein